MTSDLKGYSALSRLLSNPSIVNACQGLHRPGLNNLLHHGGAVLCPLNSKETFLERTDPFSEVVQVRQGKVGRT